MQLIHFVLGTPACSPSEGGRGGGGGAHSCPWSAGETSAPTASGWWVGPGGNGERTSCSLVCSCLESTMSHVSRGKSPDTWGSSSAQTQSQAGCTSKDKTKIGSNVKGERMREIRHPQIKYVHTEDVAIATTNCIQAGFTIWEEGGGEGQERKGREGTGEEGGGEGTGKEGGGEGTGEEGGGRGRRGRGRGGAGEEGGRERRGRRGRGRGGAGEEGGRERRGRRGRGRGGAGEEGGRERRGRRGRGRGWTKGIDC